MLIVNCYGRLGNNLAQILNVLSLNIKYLQHDKIDIRNLKKKYPIILKNFPNEFAFDYPKANEEITDIFFGINSINKYTESKPCLSVMTNQEIIQKYILPYIDCNINKNLFNNIDFDKDLIIHIRSGDVTPMLNRYIQPPLSFYEKIIQENKFRNIHIITENYLLNPVVKILQNKYKNVFFSPRIFDEDFSILINAKYIVVSNSTLSKWLCRLNKNLKIVYSNCGWAHEKGEYEVKFTNTPSYYQLKFQNYQEKEDAILKYKI